MTVKELIEKLQTFPQDLPVAYNLYSEYCLLEAKDIRLETLGVARADGWVHFRRPGEPTAEYVLFPGN